MNVVRFVVESTTKNVVNWFCCRFDNKTKNYLRFVVDSTTKLRIDIGLLSNRQQNVVMQFNPPTPQGKLSGQSASTYRQIIIEIVILTAVYINKTITRHPQSPPEC